jgi:hypothetical protein
VKGLVELHRPSLGLDVGIMSATEREVAECRKWGSMKNR